jgi:hypothetical protein
MFDFSFAPGIRKCHLDGFFLHIEAYKCGKLFYSLLP